MELTEYKPFKDIDNYYLEHDGGRPTKMYFKSDKKSSFQLDIKPGGYVPKSGIFLCKSIVSLVDNKSILEIGTGETGVISIFSSKHGAKEIVAADIDDETVNWAEHNGNLNKIENIKWLVSDKYVKINGKFDLIVSNPPQLPMSSGPLHDSGGEDGRRVIDQIIVGAKNHLKPRGSITILVFDFLSVDKNYGERETIFNVLKNNGFTASIIGEVERMLNPKGKAFEAMNDIQKYYPKYNFREDELGNKFYKMLVVKGSLA